MAQFIYMENPYINYQGLEYDIATKKWSKPAGLTQSFSNSGMYSRAHILSPYLDQSIRFRVISTTTTVYRISWASSGRNLDIFTDGTFALNQDFGFHINNTDIQIFEDSTMVNNPAQAAAVGNELRIQIINEAGVLKVKYYWRLNDSSAENLLYTSVKSHADILSRFPLHLKGVFQNATNSGASHMSMEVTDSCTNCMVLDLVDEGEDMLSLFQDNGEGVIDLIDESTITNIIGGSGSNGNVRPVKGWIYPRGK